MNTSVKVFIILFVISFGESQAARFRRYKEETIDGLNTFAGTAGVVAAGSGAAGNIPVAAVAGVAAGVAAISAVGVKHGDKVAEYSVVAANEVASAGETVGREVASAAKHVGKAFESAFSWMG
jgi:hypothetical protein